MKLIAGILLILGSSLQATLKEPGWNPEVKAKLQKLIQAKRGTGLPIVFDFDNTLLCRDIGEATFEVMAKNGTLSVDQLPVGVTPPSVLATNVLDTYDQYLEVTKHHHADKAAYLNAYGWLVEIMAGLSPAQIVEATKTAFADGKRSDDVKKPFFYPEMLELVRELRKAHYDVWVVSASNVWSVRWMATQYLGIDADHVVGINTLLEGPENKLYKDQFLMLENSKYAQQNLQELSHYKLTTHMVYPMSASYGKAAAILERIGKRPYLIAGDSPNDHGMLSIAQNKLWIKRMGKADYWRLTQALMQTTTPSSWMVQDTSTGQSPGFQSGKHVL